MTFLLEIITPEKEIYKNDVDEVIVPTVTGEITILPNHSPLLSKVAPGELIVKKGQKEEPMAITGGFLEVFNNKVTILADYAVRADNIEIARAEEAKKRAEKIMQEKVGERDFAEAEAQLRRSLLELKVAKKHRRSTAS